MADLCSWNLTWEREVEQSQASVKWLLHWVLCLPPTLSPHCFMNVMFSMHLGLPLKPANLKWDLVILHRLSDKPTAAASGRRARERNGAQRGKMAFHRQPLPLIFSVPSHISRSETCSTCVCTSCASDIPKEEGFNYHMYTKMFHLLNFDQSLMVLKLTLHI